MILFGSISRSLGNWVLAHMLSLSTLGEIKPEIISIGFKLF